MPIKRNKLSRGENVISSTATTDKVIWPSRRFSTTTYLTKVQKIRFVGWHRRHQWRFRPVQLLLKRVAKRFTGFKNVYIYHQQKTSGTPKWYNYFGVNLRLHNFLSFDSATFCLHFGQFRTDCDSNGAFKDVATLLLSFIYAIVLAASLVTYVTLSKFDVAMVLVYQYLALYVHNYTRTKAINYPFGLHGSNAEVAKATL